MNPQAIQIIDALGGTAEVSRIFDLAMPSVSGWKESGIPKARMMFLEVAHASALEGIDLAAATSNPEGRPLLDFAPDRPTAQEVGNV